MLGTGFLAKIVMKKSTKLSLLALPTLAALGTGAASAYLYRYAFHRINSEPLGSAANPEPDSKYYPTYEWLQHQDKEDWWQNGDDAKHKIHAYFIPNPSAQGKIAVVAHGYHGSADAMAAFAKLFYDAGFSVLVPDERAHGQSAGDFINFGWLDRLDYHQWLDTIIGRFGPDCRIVLYGISMGAATMMMLSGDKLPLQVKAIIEDCGYTSVADQLTYQLKQGFKLPKYPFMPVVSVINQFVLGFSLKDSSAVLQLHHNQTPILFIHGTNDKFVPTKMVYDNYNATTAPKALWLVPNAGHAKSYWVNPEAYKAHVGAFLQKYL